MKVGMFIGKVKKFGISWCIPHRMAADNAPYRVKYLHFLGEINLIWYPSLGSSQAYKKKYFYSKSLL